MVELKTDSELCALLLVHCEQRYERLEQQYGDQVGEKLKLVYRAETLLCAARELYRRLLAVTQKPSRNVTANCGIPGSVTEGV